MKTLLPILLVAFILFSCGEGIHKMVTTDVKTKLTVKGDGLACDDVAIEIAGKEVHRNTFYEGEKVTLIFNDMKGFKEIKGMRYPYLEILIKNENGKVVEHAKDLIDSLGTDISPLKLTAFFSLQFDYEKGDAFKLFVKIKDKKGKGVLTAEMPFTIEPNPAIKVKNNGLKYKWAYLWDPEQDRVVTETELTDNKEYLFIIDSLSGLEEINGMVHPIVPLYIIDNKGDTILGREDLVNISSEGVPPKNLAKLPVAFKVYGDAANPITIKTGITDKKSDRFIEVSTSFDVK